MADNKAQVDLLNKYPILTGMADRLVLVGLTYLVSKGIIASGDVANFAALGTALLAAFIGWYQNRQMALAQAATTIPDTKVITSNAIAKATPENTNIVSNETKKVVNQ